MVLDNANPVILRPSDLPSRRERTRRPETNAKTNALRDILMAKPSYGLDPYYMSEFSDTDSDDSTVDPIDEQEIYGENSPFCLIYDLHATSRLKTDPRGC